MNFSREQKAGDGLHVPACHQAARPEWRMFPDLVGPNLLRAHKLILMENRIRSGVKPMPIFEYICKQCQHQFETLVYGKQKAECPKCHATKLEPQLSVFAVSAKGSAASPSAAGACGSCGDPRGPGSCSLGDMN